jgi:hypothetical protein
VDGRHWIGIFSNDSNRLNIGDEIPNIITLEVDIHA